MPARWGTVAAYAAVAAANQLLWLTYAPITTDAAKHFGVSEGAVGWLSQVFPLLYVVLAIPAGLALDRRFRDRGRRPRAGHPGPSGRRVLARCGHRRARPHGRLKEAARVPRTPTA